MKRILPSPRALAFLAALFLLAICSRAIALPTPPPSPGSSLEMIATNGAGKEKHLVSQAGFVGQLVVRPNQAVPVILQFPSDKVGTLVTVASLDGGDVTAASSVILPTGRALFTFRGEGFGLYRIKVRLPAEEHLIEFYVLDPNHPRRPVTGN